jgi:hypothetical protein
VAIGHEINIRMVTAEQALAHYRAQGGWAAVNAEFLLGFHSYSGGDPDSEQHEDPNPPIPPTAER